MCARPEWEPPTGDHQQIKDPTKKNISTKETRADLGEHTFIDWKIAVMSSHGLSKIHGGRAVLTQPC